MQFISKEITESLLLFAIEQTDFVIKSTEKVLSYNDFLTSIDVSYYLIQPVCVSRL